jgi:hypothetical protein
MTSTLTGWDRAMAAAEDVRDRMRRAAAALDAGGVPYAVVGGNAVAEWVGSVDRDAVRITKDVDILLRRSDLPAAAASLAPAGFVFADVAGVGLFLDGPSGTPRSAVHVVYAGEKVRAEYAVPAPDVSAAEPAPNGLRVLGLQALVAMKLTSYRRKDQVHLQDLHGVGLIDATWPARFPPPLGDRLQAILDDPDG